MKKKPEWVVPIILLLILLIGGCKPATSDIYVEQVDEAYIQALAQKADIIKKVELDSTQIAFGAVSAVYYVLAGGQKNLLLAYNEQGRVISMKEWQEGILTDSIIFYPNGQRMTKVTFNRNGKLEGLTQRFYSDGRLMETGRIALGVKIGVWQYFDQAGKLKYSEEYNKWGQKR